MEKAWKYNNTLNKDPDFIRDELMTSLARYCNDLIPNFDILNYDIKYTGGNTEFRTSNFALTKIFPNGVAPNRKFTDEEVKAFKEWIKYKMSEYGVKAVACNNYNVLLCVDNDSLSDWE